jgi:predicted RNase H-like nuclease (RuvC/YqgF family)
MNLAPTSFESILNTILIIVGFGVTIFFLWRTKAVTVYKDAVEAYEVRLKQLEETIVKIEKENKELHSQLNQLIGENKALKDLLTYQDPSFRNEIKAILDTIKDLRTDFQDHCAQDDSRFSEVLDGIKYNREYYAKNMNKTKE